MKAVIVAAGMATRLRPLTDKTHKTLLKVGDKPILERIISNLISSGIEELVMTLGYRSDDIVRFVRETFPSLPFMFQINPIYANTNNEFSLLLARPYLENSDFILLDSDVLFDTEVIERVAGDGAEVSVAVKKMPDIGEEEVKVKVNGEMKIEKIGKDVTVKEAYGESVGIEKFSADAGKKLFEVVERRVLSGEGMNEFYELAFQEMIDRGIEFKAVDITDLKSMEIDTAEDLETARQLFGE